MLARLKHKSCHVKTQDSSVFGGVGGYQSCSSRVDSERGLTWPEPRQEHLVNIV